MRWLMVLTMVASCGEDDRGPGATSSVERVESTLPLPDTACFTQRLLDVLPSTAGMQYECTALLDGDVMPSCGTNEPCWEIVATTNATCTNAPAVRGGNAGQLLSIDCVVEE